MSEINSTPRTDPVVDDYLRRTLLSRDALQRDPQYALQVQWLRETLASSDEAMQAEGIPADVRDRVVRRVLYGSLDEEGAVARIAAHRSALEQAQWQSPRLEGSLLRQLFEAPAGQALFDSRQPST